MTTIARTALRYLQRKGIHHTPMLTMRLKPSAAKTHYRLINTPVVPRFYPLAPLAATQLQEAIIT